MANPISEQIKTGTIGEPLVQLRLLQYDIQAAPPLKDSGNDLIAIKRNSFKAIQVKTTTNEYFSKPDNARIYHILAVVYLQGEDKQLFLDSSKIYLISKNDVAQISTNINSLNKKYELNQYLLDELFD